MDIYIVQPSDTIEIIADNYGTTVYQLIQDNGLDNPYSLVPGQTIIITNPSQTHIVGENETLSGIAELYDVSLLQLLRNNSFLSDRNNIFPGETLVISYNTHGSLLTNGYSYQFINRNTLRKTLPYLTYLSVFNYRISNEGEIITYGDDSDIIQTAKDYGVIPLMMMSFMTPQGEPNVEIVYNILLSEELHDRLVNNILNLLKTSGYFGLNIMISGITTINQRLYIDLLSNISNFLSNEGFQLFLTINPNIRYENNEIVFEQLDYETIGQLVNGITFFQYAWASTPGPPAPVSSINFIQTFIDYVVTLIPPEKISIGKPLIGYDWELPYVPGSTIANSLTINSAINLANNTNTSIQFNDTSQTPYFYYQYFYGEWPINHIVWFLDARSIKALDLLIAQYNLSGSGIWNIMVYYQQMWTMLNSQFDIIKLIPDNIQ